MVTVVRRHMPRRRSGHTVAVTIGTEQFCLTANQRDEDGGLGEVFIHWGKYGSSTRPDSGRLVENARYADRYGLDTDYAMTASQALGTRHTLTPADGPYAAYLLDALATTGEPLNHVQSAYFGHLARAMHTDGVSAGLCGEGADSLFGAPASS